MLNGMKFSVFWAGEPGGGEPEQVGGQKAHGSS